MTPDGIRERFDLYRKWFNTFLVKEFLNLPTKYQDRFIALIEMFLANCKKMYEEGKKVQEKVIQIIATKVILPDNKEESYVVVGKSSDSEDEIRINFPIRMPHPKIGAKLYHTVFSFDGEVWYSSKEELIASHT
jgi:hypothetical protein